MFNDSAAFCGRLAIATVLGVVKCVGDLNNRITDNLLRVFQWRKVWLLVVVATATPASGGDWTTRTSIGGGIGYTDNVNLAPSGSEESDLVLGVSPLLQARGVSGRSSANLSLGGTQIVSLTGSGNTQFVPRLQAGGSYELIKQRVFMDASAGLRRTFSVRDDRVSATGASNSGRNTGDLSLGMSWQEHLGTYADFSARYRYGTFFSDADTVSNTHRHLVDLAANSGRGTPKLAWNAFYRDGRSNGGDDNTASSAGINAIYNLINDLQIIGTYGRFDGNSNQQGIVGANNGDRFRVGLAWTPGVHSLLSFAAGPGNWAANAAWGYSDKFQIFGHYGRNGRDDFSDLTGGRPFWDTRLLWRPSSRLSVDVGYFRPEFGLNSEQANWEGLITFDWPRTRIRIRGTQQTTTTQLQLAQSGFVIDPDTGNPVVGADGNLLLQGTPLVSATDEIFVSRCLELNASRVSRKNRFDFNAGIEKRSFDNQADDETGYGGNLLWQYTMAPTTSFDTQVAYRVTRFENDNTEDRQWGARLAVRKRLGRRLSVGLQYAFNQLFSTDGAREYAENTVLLTFNYGLGSSRGGLSGGVFGSGSGISGGNARVGNFACGAGGGIAGGTSFRASDNISSVTNLGGINNTTPTSTAATSASGGTNTNP